MRSKIADKILAKTPKDVEIYVRLYGDIVVRIHELIQENGFNQQKLAEKMDKKPSEISKWLNGDHNFTIRSLAKLQAELGEPIINVPRRKKFERADGKKITMTVTSNIHSVKASSFEPAKASTTTQKIPA